MSEPDWAQFLNREYRQKLALERKQAADTITTLTKERDDARKAVAAALEGGEVAQAQMERWRAHANLVEQQNRERESRERSERALTAESIRLMQDQNKALQARVTELETWMEMVRRENWQPPAAEPTAPRPKE